MKLENCSKLKTSINESVIVSHLIRQDKRLNMAKFIEKNKNEFLKTYNIFYNKWIRENDV